MQLEATGQPIRYRLKTGEEVTLRPGVPMELPDKAATQLLQKAPAMVRRVESVSAIQLGALISWHGAGLTLRHGLVEFLHTDTDGTTWAFCTLKTGWCAVNTRFITEVDHG